MGGDGVGDPLRERLSIDCESASGGNRGLVGRFHHERPQPTHLLLEQPDGVQLAVGAQRIAADQLGKALALMGGRKPHRLHLEEGDLEAAPRGLPGGLAAREPGADHRDAPILRFRNSRDLLRRHPASEKCSQP
jgi:hypothetical protein